MKYNTKNCKKWVVVSVEKITSYQYVEADSEDDAVSKAQYNWTEFERDDVEVMEIQGYPQAQFEDKEFRRSMELYIDSH